MGKFGDKKSDDILFYVFPVVIRHRDEGTDKVLNALAGADDDEMSGGDDIGSGDHEQFEESEATESKVDDDEVMSKILIRCVKRSDFPKKKKKDSGQSGKGDGAEQIDDLKAVRMLVEPPSLPKIQEAFARIHEQQHKNLMEILMDCLVADDDSDSDGDEDDDDGGGDAADNVGDSLLIDDEDLAEMKVFLHFLLSLCD